MRVQHEQEALKRRVSKPTTFVGLPGNAQLSAQSLPVTSQRKLSAGEVLSLQQTRGNASVCRMLATRQHPAVQCEPDTDDQDDQQAQQPAATSSTDTQPAASQPDDTAPSDSDNQLANQPDTTQADNTNTSPSDGNPPDASDTTNTDNTDDGGTLTGDPIQGEATPVEVEANAGCEDLDLQGLTNASYGGSFSTGQINYTNIGGDVQATGMITCNYTVSTRVTLPSVPSGLSQCETNKVNNAIRTILAPHEQQHVAAFRGYAGRTVRQFNFTLSGMNTSAGSAALSAAVRPLLQQMHDTERASRQAASDAASASLDPFHFNVDCSDCN